MRSPARKDSAPRAEVTAWRMVWMAATITLVLGGCLLVWSRLEQFLMRDPRFALNGADGSADMQTLEVSGAAHASRRQIELVFAEDSGRSVYLMPLNDRRATLRTVEWVKDASISRVWPNRVLVKIHERTPVAFVELPRSKFALIDEDGVILPPAADRFEVPVLTGVRSSDVPADRRDRVHRMIRLMRELGDASSKISGVDVSDPDNLKVTQPLDGRVVTLLLGDQNWGARYQNFVRSYPQIKQRLPDATKLDMRLEDRITVVE
ncbi:MAG TPA: FtsQ-type POTRA domain-containing protein [Bryobacteraceae bacterium]|nr:FtsQ-type POTRA domain-containing protein [Bryobacteraceae bacterium]